MGYTVNTITGEVKKDTPTVSTGVSNYKPLREYLDSIPNPKWWQFRARFVVWWSNMIDDYHIRKWERKRK
jgi:hypothetical protein